MQTSQMVETPVTRGPTLRPRSGRTPLQPKNSPANPILDPVTPPKSKQKPIEISVMKLDSNKENLDPTKLEPLDASLAEELSAIKKKLERLRSDKERTEKMLNERDSVLDGYLKEMELRGQFQKCLEMEVDRLFRLKELKSRCMRVSPIKSLREKEQGKTISDSPSEVKTQDMVESGEEYESRSPGSSSSRVDMQKT
ncbi:high mobility group B protein 6 [Neltuma alba]|uniref:high mobility group B protein 6 n=1 Tax=Neltuma alba TaxID=207710 RepID=UPI0010A57BC0|nr:high mobility group B protein 6 [Prosopis alba]